MIVDLWTRKREIRYYSGNHHGKLRMQRTSCAGQFTNPGMEGVSPNVWCNNTDTRSSRPNQARSTPDFEYLLVIPHIILICLPISPFVLHNFSIISEHKGKSSLRFSACHDQAFILSTAYTPDCLSSLHSHEDGLTPECSLNFGCASLLDRPPSASSR